MGSGLSLLYASSSELLSEMRPEKRSLFCQSLASSFHSKCCQHYSDLILAPRLINYLPVKPSASTNTKAG
jgi:hypothetical protein